MRYMFLLRGCPGAGKSTFIKENYLGPHTLCPDDFRLQVSSPVYNIAGDLTIDQSIGKIAWNNFYAALENRMKNGSIIFVDATCSTRKELLNYRSKAKDYNYRVYIIDFTDIPAAVCISRNEFRAEYKRVPRDVINKFNSRFSDPENIIPSGIKVLKPGDAIDFINNLYNALDFNGYRKVHFIGDIHGCYTALLEYLTKKTVDFNLDAFIFTGDYFDRGIENDKVFNFLSTFIDRPNVFMLIGNHEVRMIDYLRGGIIGIINEHSTFYKKTLKQMHDNGITDKQMKSFCHKLVSAAYFIFGNNKYIVTHGGIPVPEINPYIPESVYINGTGSYEDMESVACTFKDKCKTVPMYKNHIQVFGHRNNKDVAIKIDTHNYNICGFPECGGDLKVLVVDEHGHTPIYIQNENFSQDLFYNALERYPDRFRDKLTAKDMIHLYRQSAIVNESKYGDISSFNFTPEAFYDDLWNGATVKARGMFINTKTEKIVARSYDKFFILDQHPSSSLETVCETYEFPLNVYTKYDGYLGIIGYDEELDDLTFHSKSAMAPLGTYADKFKSMILPCIKDYDTLKEWIKLYKVSLVFEVVNPAFDPHLVKYNENFVVLLDIVENSFDYKVFNINDGTGYNIDSGYRIFVKRWFNDTDDCKVKVKELFMRINNVKAFRSSLDALKDPLLTEGYVIIDNTGKRMFKLKTTDFEFWKRIRAFFDEYYKVSMKKALAGYMEKGIIDHTPKLDMPKKSGFFSRYKKFYPEHINDLYTAACNIVALFNDNPTKYVEMPFNDMREIIERERWFDKK